MPAHEFHGVEPMSASEFRLAVEQATESRDRAHVAAAVGSLAIAHANLKAYLAAFHTVARSSADAASAWADVAIQALIGGHSDATREYAAAEAMTLAVGCRSYVVACRTVGPVLPTLDVPGTIAALELAAKDAERAARACDPVSAERALSFANGVSLNSLADAARCRVVGGRVRGEPA